MVGGAVVSGVAANKKAKEDRKNANADRAVATRESTVYDGVLSQFEREQDDYYSQLNRQRKQRGLEQFRQFNTMSQFAPNYTPAAQQEIVVPVKPSIANNLDAAVRQDEANQKIGTETAQPQSKKGGGLVKKIVDPLGLF